MDYLKSHYETEGPLGLPMKDRQARRLETLLKDLPAEDRQLVRVVKTRPPSELLPGERADVSWITTEEIDRDAEIVSARGMNETHFQQNPIVTLQHAYHLPPVGRSLWRKRAKDGPVVGVKAKTQYPVRPETWTGPDWPADNVFALVQAGLMNGKSIGFLRLKSHVPSSHEVAARPELAGVSRIIDEWLLLEYACVFLPCNQGALVELVSKGQMDWSPDLLRLAGLDSPLRPGTISFTSEQEVVGSIRRRLAGLQPQALVAEAIDRARGRI